jgi:integrase
MLKDKEFAGFHDGIFKTYFEEYIEFRRGKGEKVTHSTLIRLKALNNNLNQYCPSLEINADVVKIILQEKDGESPSSRMLRVSDLRQFTSFLRGHGIHAFQVPAKYTKRVHTLFRPYIFSKMELCAITDVADKYESKSREKHQLDIYSVIARILIGTGMRIGEVLSLRVQDVNIQTQSFTIHCGKNSVSRHVPMSPSLFYVIDQYLADITHSSQPCQPLFISPYTGGSYSYDAMNHMFKNIYGLAGIRTPQGKLPRIHDIRHTFCTTSLNKMIASGMSLYVAVPLLAAYVGHVNLRDTERYIHLTEHSYGDFIEKQRGLQSLIPEVCSDEG